MSKITRLSASLKALIFMKAQRQSVVRDQVLVKPGEVCDYLYFIEDGILGCYMEVGKKKHYTWLMLAGDIATAVNSFNLREPSTETIRALTDCQLYLLSWNDLEEICGQYKAFRIVRQRFTDKYYIQRCEMDTKRLQGAEATFDYLRENFPKIMKDVPHNIVASYMGISPAKLYEIKRTARNYK